MVSSDAEEFLQNFDLEAVNAELGPWIAMTGPEELRRHAVINWPTGRPLFSSWVLLLGLLPIDRHHFQLEAADPKQGFLERSSSWMMDEWRHDRVVEQTGEQLRVTDRVRYRTRLPGLGWLLAPVYRAVFRHRHRRLRRRLSGGDRRSP